MAAERVVLCGHRADAAGVPGSAEAVPLRADGREPNVSVKFGDLRQGVYTEVPPAFLDLVDVATYVYAADQAVPRTGGGDFEPCWRRNLVFRVPVRVPDLWRSAPVQDALVSTLSFLSEDEYRFEFEPAADPPPAPYYFDFGTTAFDGLVEEVGLFSGGLDSLAGAVQEAVVDRRKVLLVNHRSNPKPGPQYDRLTARLAELAGAAAPFHLSVRINKRKELSRDAHQRARSFLYAAVGAAFAHVVGLGRVRFYENGVMSLNLPLGGQEVGARATRTTHPRVLAGMSRLFTALAGRPLVVENPFFDLTKTDVVRLVADAGCGDLIGLTRSCVRTRGSTIEHPHCGDCSQCLDRRFAVLAADQAGHDPADRYAVDLLTGGRPGEASRTLLAAYVETANRVERMTADEFFREFGEAYRAVRHLPGPPAEAARRVHALYRRHAGQVCGGLDRALASFGSAGHLRRGTLPPTCLVRLMLDDGEPAVEEPPRQTEAPNRFRRRGQAWDVRFAGREDMILLPSRGAAYLHALLGRPLAAIRSVDLLLDAVKEQRAGREAAGDAGEATDKDSLAAYRQKVLDLDEEIDRAKRTGDTVMQDVAERERQAILGHLKRVSGLKGQARKAGADLERIRKSVTNAVGRAVSAIRSTCPGMADHLEAHLTRGVECRYCPPTGVTWET